MNPLSMQTLSNIWKDTHLKQEYFFLWLLVIVKRLIFTAEHLGLGACDRKCSCESSLSRSISGGGIFAVQTSTRSQAHRHVHAHTQARAHTHTHRHAHTHTHTGTCTHTHTRTHTCTRRHTQARAHTHACTHSASVIFRVIHCECIVLYKAALNIIIYK